MYNVSHGFNFTFSKCLLSHPSFILKVHLYFGGFKCHPYHILNFHLYLSLFLDFLFYSTGPVPVPHCFDSFWLILVISYWHRHNQKTEWNAKQKTPVAEKWELRIWIIPDNIQKTLSSKPFLSFFFFSFRVHCSRYQRDRVLDTVVPNHRLSWKWFPLWLSEVHHLRY